MDDVTTAFPSKDHGGTGFRAGTSGNGKVQGRVLVMEDEPEVRSLLRRALEHMGHQVVEAGDGKEGIERLDEALDLILLDIGMPNLDGLAFLRNLRESDTAFKHLPVIVVTGLNDEEARREAFQAGANDFLAKPFEALELELRTTAQIRLKRTIDELRRGGDAVGAGQEDWSFYLSGADSEEDLLRDPLAEAALETLQHLVTAGEFRDGRSPAHVIRVGKICRLVAEKVHLPPAQLRIIGPASSLHDIGMTGIPESIPRKPGPLTLQERAIMERHSYLGGRILRGASNPLFRMAGLIAITHHERWDGTGYPMGLSGLDIPLVGRICAVADVFDALTSDRPYRQAFSNHEALEILRQTRGEELDPVVVDAFLASMPDVERIQAELPEEPRTWLDAQVLEFPRRAPDDLRTHERPGHARGSAGEVQL